VLTGLIYPLAVTMIGQVAFADRANGSIVAADGRRAGSRLIGQLWEGEEWFHGRPSAVDADAAASGGSNLGPTSDELAITIGERLDAVVALETPYRADLERSEVPVDLVTASGSGLDPHISPEAARFQVPRVASVRGLPVQQVEELVEAATNGRFLVFGEPSVNVLELNLALDRVAP
jgi:K+-transporting ATPase ATPase C chain